MELSFDLCHGYICNAEKDIEFAKEETVNVDKPNGYRPVKPVIVSEPINIPTTNEPTSLE